MRKLQRCPVGHFGGSNFMTPSIAGYYELKPGLFAELSQGTGMSRQVIWGVTVSPDPGNKLSKGAFQTYAGAYNYMLSLAVPLAGDED